MKMDEPVQVEAVRDAKGRLTPKSFVFGGETYAVHQIGRSWDDGEWQHTLVMSRDGQTWDLAFSVDQGAWRLMARTSPGRGTLI
jgi:hypothetical protein